MTKREQERVAYLVAALQEARDENKRLRYAVDAVELINQGGEDAIRRAESHLIEGGLTDAAIRALRIHIKNSRLVARAALATPKDHT